MSRAASRRLRYGSPPVARRTRLDRIGVAFDGSAESVVAPAHGGLLAEERECEKMMTVEDSDRLDAFADEVDVPLIVTAPVDSAAVARWQERHPEAGAYGTR